MPSFILITESVLFAFVMGLIPVLIWLGFWLFEDAKRPEPKNLIFLAFISGMAAVLFVLPFQELAAAYLPMGSLLLFAWAAIEEVVKFLVAWVVVLRRREVDEPMDFPIYLITVSLGFAALENAFFLFHPVSDGNFFTGLVTGDLRFIGATLVHVLSTSIIGGALAFAYYRERSEKILFGIFGVILAILLHGFFNFLILTSGSSGVLTVFLGVWAGIIFILLGLERIKSMHPPFWWTKTFIKRGQLKP